MSRSTDPPTSPTAAGRLVSLDAFRGLTIAGMILVNNPGSGSHVYAPLRHAEWHGFTPTDLVFPSFLFIAGAAIPLALDKRRERGDTPGAITGKILRRSLIIFALGLILNAVPFDKPLATLRIPGVLQRIALCYLTAALIYQRTSLRVQVLIATLLLGGYWALMTLVPVPGVGPGDLSRPNNLAAWVDRGLLPGHLYKSDYDPEGLLSTLPAIATTLIGVLTGRWLSGLGRSTAEKFAGVFAAGSVLLFAGSVWGAYFPINKALWTSSFVLYAGGLSLLIFGLCGWLIEVVGVRRWSWPFVAMGANPIAAYVLSGLLLRVLGMVHVAGPEGAAITPRQWIYSRGYSWADPTFASLLFPLSYVLFWLAVTALLYRLRIIIKV